MTRAWPANAQTSINNVDSGRWKLVTSASTTRNVYPGAMKSAVSPAPARTQPRLSAADSSVRTTVVPTATTRPLHALTACAVAAGTS